MYHARLELFREFLLVQKDVWVLELLVEAVLHLLHAANDAVQVAVSGCGSDERATELLKEGAHQA